MYTELNILRLNERINTSNGFWDDMYNPYCTWSSWRADGQQRRGTQGQAAKSVKSVEIPSTLFITRRTMTHAAEFQITRERMRDYLRNPGPVECRLTISHSRVVQKSYRNERRFFCLPPTVTLEGGGWQQLCMFMIPGRVWYQASSTEMVSGIYGVINNGCGDGERLEFKGKNYAQAKMAITSDHPRFGTSEKSSKPTFFNLTVTLLKSHDELIGCFKSDRIKVISKKPKKKLSIKNSDCKALVIISGSTVALSCKTKTFSTTRFMFADGTHFVGSAERWSSLEICLVDETGRFEDGYVYYNNVVTLRDPKTGHCHPPVRICRVEGKEKMKVMPGGNEEPVCQLYKCAFQFTERGKEHLYLAMGSQNEIMEYDAIKDGQLSDAAVWTIASSSDTEFRFFYADQNKACHTLPTHIPVVHKLFIQNNTIFLEGDNFDRNMIIWIGDVPVTTTFRHTWLLTCPMPDLRSLQSCPMAVDEECAQIQVSLAYRGIVFATGQVLQITRGEKDLYERFAMQVVIQ
uniref:Recombining binding protein suppressor of hairless-like n=2 Tax=Steinernema glaseri TaxID=37863 RepID=A0A1I8AGX0_9BILA